MWRHRVQRIATHTQVSVWAPEMYDSSLGLVRCWQPYRPCLTRLSGSSPLALASILQSLRPRTLQQQSAQLAYRAEVEQIADRMRNALDEWVRMREIEPDNMRLANAAAVNRWELMRLAHEVEQRQPPRKLAGVHRDVHDSVLAAARACQLLANGYRFYKSEAVCDGQALLVETVQTISGLAAQFQMRF